MDTITRATGRSATELAARAICPRVGYYFKVTPHHGGEHFWAGAYPDHMSANEARRRNYLWPKYYTDAPWYFTDGSRLF